MNLRPGLKRSHNRTQQLDRLTRQRQQYVNCVGLTCSDNGKIARPLILSQCARKLVGVDLGQVSADNRNVWRVAERQAQRGDPIGRLEDVRPSLAEHRGGGAACPPIVIRHQDCDAFHSALEYRATRGECTPALHTKTVQLFWFDCPTPFGVAAGIVSTGRRRRGPYATSPPRLPCDLPPPRVSILVVAAKVFQLRVDDEIALVLAEERHAQAMTDLILRNQARLARWEPWAEHPATLDATRAYIRTALEDFVRGRQISTIITLDSGQRFIGRCGLRLNPYAGSGDIGYWIDGEFEGRGITTRSARTLISSAFQELGLSKMELRTSVGNRRSRAVAERLGFNFEGVMPGGLQFAKRADDVALYGVTSKAWVSAVGVG